MIGNRYIDPSLRLAAAQLGRQGGLSRSPAKIAAARVNGRKGGRPPRKRPPSPPDPSTSKQ